MVRRELKNTAMEIRVDRKYKKTDYTIGKMYVDGVYFCDTLEDTVRDSKIAGITAIPSGVYRVELTYSPKFKRDLPLICDVPHFTGIRIHRGNTPEDTSGCILVGENKERGRLVNSTRHELELVKKIKEVGGIAIIKIE